MKVCARSRSEVLSVVDNYTQVIAQGCAVRHERHKSREVLVVRGLDLQIKHKGFYLAILYVLHCFAKDCISALNCREREVYVRRVRIRIIDGVIERRHIAPVLKHTYVIDSEKWRRVAFQTAHYLLRYRCSAYAVAARYPRLYVIQPMTARMVYLCRVRGLGISSCSYRILIFLRIVHALLYRGNAQMQCLIDITCNTQRDADSRRGRTVKERILPLRVEYNRNIRLCYRHINIGCLLLRTLTHGDKTDRLRAALYVWRYVDSCVCASVRCRL